MCLQGKLWQAHTDTNKAIECYAESLKLNPFMWDAFLGLCDLGTLVVERRVEPMLIPFRRQCANVKYIQDDSGDDESIVQFG